MSNRTSVVLCASVLLLLCVSSAEARKKKCKKSSCETASCTYNCTNTCTSCCTACEGSYGCDNCGYSTVESVYGGCCSSVGYGTILEGTVIEGHVIEGSVIEGSIIEGTTIEGSIIKEKTDAEKDVDNPFISSSGVHISTAAIVSASLQRPQSSDQLLTVSINSEKSRQVRSYRSTSVAQMYYSEGLGAYWRGNLTEARGLLTKGVAASDQDARLWYFKALSEVQLGLGTEAVTSLGMAVRVEAQHPDQARQINAALERVQGPLRIKIQRARTAGQRVQAERIAHSTEPVAHTSR